MARGPSRSKLVGNLPPGPDEDPLVGDGGSEDEMGWEAPTRPDHPLPPPGERGRRGPRRNAPGQQEPPRETN